MTPTLFDPPYQCTDAEYAALTGAGSAEEAAWMRAIDLDPTASDDARWARILDLCHLRGDRSGMDQALAQIQDRAWAAELAYRDVILDLSEWPR